MTEYDETYYEKLMDGLEAIEINLSICKGMIDFRIDASTYKKDYVRTEKILKSLNVFSIEDEMKSIQNFGAYSLCNDIVFSDYGVPFLMTQNIRHNYIDWSNIRYIDKASHNMLHKSHCKKGQVLVTMAGEYLGRAAVYDQDFVCSSNQAIAKVTLKDGVAPYYVATFLNSRYGQNQINRLKTVTGQPNINMALIKSLVIPHVSERFSKVIEKIVISSNMMFQQGKDYYQEAEQLLIDTLGLEDFNPKTEKYSIKTLKKSFGDTGRLDAEFYQSYYEEFEQRIKSNGFVTASEICSLINYGTVPTSLYTEDGSGIPYIKGMNVKNVEVQSDNLDRITNTGKLPEKFYTKKGDIIISQMGTVADCGVVEETQENWLFASFTIRLRLKDFHAYNPYFIGMYIQSLAKKYYFHRYIAQASVRQNTDLPTVNNLFIPIVDKNIQNVIADKIKESKQRKKKGSMLLNKAVNLVEIAIEQGEDVALKLYE